MNARLPVALLLPLSLILSSGCSRERARVVEADAVAEPEKKTDYREMVTQARSRQDAEDSLVALKSACNNFMRDQGRLPSNLVEMVELKYLPELPAPPDGETFVYDPIAGNIHLVAQDKRVTGLRGQGYQPPVATNPPVPRLPAAP